MKATSVERALWVIGAMLIACYAAVRVDAEASRREGIESFTRLSARASNSVLREIAATPADQSRWSEGRIRAYALDVTTHPKAVPEALLRIPSVKLSVPVYADTSALSLNRGAGWISGTAGPRAAGNMGIAAHRDGFFRALKDVALGDRLELESLSGTRVYRVSALYIVIPEDTRPLRPTESATVTLVTCYPFYYVGSAPQRYIVRAIAIAP
jgi:sortase A